MSNYISELILLYTIAFVKTNSISNYQKIRLDLKLLYFEDVDSGSELGS